MLKRKLILTVFLLALAVPTFAQDAELTAEPVVAPVTNVTIEDGGSATFEQPAPEPLSDEPAPVTVVETSEVSNDTLLIVGVLIVGFIGMAVVIARGGNPDTAAANQFNAWQMNRDFMAAQERAYATATAERKMFIDALASITSAIAPLTMLIKADDALARYLRDVQTPGPEPMPPAAP